MKIVNKGRLLLSSQLDRLINQLGDKYRPSVLVVCENRWDLFQYFITDSQLITSLADISLWTGKADIRAPAHTDCGAGSWRWSDEKINKGLPAGYV